MPEPLTLSLVAGAALTEGIKFLYGQAGEVLKRWRERKNGPEAKGAAATPEAEPIQVMLPEVFEGRFNAPKIHYSAVEQVEKGLVTLRGELSEYLPGGLNTVDSHDETLLKKIDALRQLLEQVYQQRITFRGETRPPSGSEITGSIDVERVLGDAAGVRAGTIRGGKVTGEARVGTVEAGGTLSGVRVENIEG